MNTKITTPVLVSTLAIALMFGALMVTHAAEDIQQITVCVNNAGIMRLRGGMFGNCRKNETELSWNKQGLKGDKGDKGDQGLQGERGEQGEQGIQGIQGLKGDTGEKGEKGDGGTNGRELHLVDANGQDLGIIVHGLREMYSTYIPEINTLATFQAQPKKAVLDITTRVVYFTELDCKGTAFSTNLAPIQLYHVSGSDKYIVRASSINPSDSLLAKSFILDTPEGCKNNREVPDATEQVLVNFVTPPFSVPLAHPLEIQVR